MKKNFFHFLAPYLVVLALIVLSYFMLGPLFRGLAFLIMFFAVTNSLRDYLVKIYDARANSVAGEDYVFSRKLYLFGTILFIVFANQLSHYLWMIVGGYKWSLIQSDTNPTSILLFTIITMVLFVSLYVMAYMVERHGDEYVEMKNKNSK